VASFLGPDGQPLGDAAALALLATIGTEVHRAGSEDDVVAAVLAPDERGVRVEVTADPPADEAGALEGMGAWHVNAQDEAHTVLSGLGLMQFVTPSGIVTVAVEGGDVVVVRGGEHRYRPMTPQAWAIRHSGGSDADLGARETGRQPWPWIAPD
jgi:mannose-6-phosphate isomerase-like protein (cupin superfamily)